MDPVLCPAQRVGLVLYPTTLAPDTGRMPVTTQCADNSHLQAGSNPIVRCTSTGSWAGQTPVCECDTGYEAAGEQICQSE